jgi:hypothetical protein
VRGLRSVPAHRGIVAITVGKGSFDFIRWGVIAVYILCGVRELGLSAAGKLASVGADKRVTSSCLSTR